jgi:predicted porin
VITKFTTFAQWNNMFNVDWTNDLGGGVYKGYPSESTDVMAGARYRYGKWVASTGIARLGKGTNDNPSARGRDMNDNTATIGTLGLNYEFGNGLQIYGLAGLVHYGHLGLSPISMPGNSAFTNVDSRVAQDGNWVGLGVVYSF